MKDSKEFRVFDNIEDVLTPFKWWKVDEKGNITYLGTPKREIAADELMDRNWLSHLLGQGIEGSAEFYFAFLLALRNAGYSSLTIDIINHHNPVQAK